jgi:hypothetical protein
MGRDRPTRSLLASTTVLSIESVRPSVQAFLGALQIFVSGLLRQPSDVPACRIGPSNNDDPDALSGAQRQAVDRSKNTILELGFDDCHAATIAQVRLQP